MVIPMNVYLVDNSLTSVNTIYEHTTTLFGQKLVRTKLQG